MVHVEVHHKVSDYAKWKEVFDEQAKTRKESGSKGARIFRDRNDPNNVAVLYTWDDIARSRTFFDSAFLRNTAGKAGIVGNPEIFFEVERADG